MSPINSPAPGNRKAWFQTSGQRGLHPWFGLRQRLTDSATASSNIIGQRLGSVALEALPDYYLNCNSAKRLWQDWRVLRRLFIRRDHSRDLLLQGQSGWLPIHGMLVSRQLLTITTDEGETVLDLDRRVVWLSRANPANTRADIERCPAALGYSYRTLGCFG